MALATFRLYPSDVKEQGTALDRLKRLLRPDLVLMIGDPNIYLDRRLRRGEQEVTQGLQEILNKLGQ